jgi:hypothetical protein
MKKLVEFLFVGLIFGFFIVIVDAQSTYSSGGNVYVNRDPVNPLTGDATLSTWVRVDRLDPADAGKKLQNQSVMHRRLNDPYGCNGPDPDESTIGAPITEVFMFNNGDMASTSVTDSCDCAGHSWNGRVDGFVFESGLWVKKTGYGTTCQRCPL